MEEDESPQLGRINVVCEENDVRAVFSMSSWAAVSGEL
jgi:hypothetical protein